MSEWLKALLSAAGGFTVAILAEPGKVRLLHWLQRRRINHAIYSELGRAYHLLDYANGIGLKQRLDLTPQEWKTRARTEELVFAVTDDAYKHHLDKDREFLLELDGYPAFKNIYNVIGRLIAAPAWQQKEPVIEEVFKQFEKHFHNGTLDSKLLLSCRAQHRERTHQENFDRTQQRTFWKDHS